MARWWWAIAACVALATAPGRVFAGVGDFLPRPLNNDLILEATGRYERDDSRGGAHPIDWTDSFLKEKLTLFSYGYFYHPRFLQYQFSLGGTISQEKYLGFGVPPLPWRHQRGVEYGVRLFLLPEHPYNLELFSRRYEPVHRERSAARADRIATSNGATFRYRRKPYFVHSGFTDDSTRSSDTTTNVKKLELDAQYFRRFASGRELSFGGSVNPNWFDTSSGTQGHSSEYQVTSLVNVQRLRLDSTLGFNSSNQTSAGSADRFESEQFDWNERLDLFLWWNFRAQTTFRYQDGSSHLATDSGTRQTLASHGSDLRFDLIHKLYSSLDSTYSFSRGARTSSGGETSTLSHGLNFSYTKRTPAGRLLVGLNLARSQTDNMGARGADIVSEPHAGIAVPTGTFTLQQRNVDEASIVVLLRSPLPPFELVPLERSLHYVLTPAGQASFQVQIFALPPAFAVPGSYDFAASYSLTGGDFAVRVDSLGGNASLEMFGRLLTPYVSYATVDAAVVSGAFPGVPVDSTAYAAGVTSSRGPLRLRAEYQVLDWEVSPFKAWRADAQFVGSISRTATLNAIAAYQNKQYRTGASSFYLLPFDEVSRSLSGSVNQRFCAGLMNLSLGGSWSRLDGQVTSDAYSLDASWNWRVAKLDVSIGASALRSDTTGPQEPTTRREHDLVYVRIKRQFF